MGDYHMGDYHLDSCSPSCPMESSDVESDLDDLCPWQNLTDPLLLDIFCHLDARSLLNAAQTCKNWHRLAHYDMLWKHLLQTLLDKAVTLPLENLTWQEEYKRVTYHVPDQLVQTCTGHRDEVYHVAFSPSGQYMSTTGRDGSVRLWKFGNSTKMICSKSLVSSGYSRYSQFNQSETLLLVGGLKGSFFHEGYICINSVPDLDVLYAVKGEYTNFRGTWLDDRTFLNASHYFDDRTYFKLDSHTVPPRGKIRSHINDIEALFEHCHSRGKQVLKTFPCNPRNDYIRVVDPRQWMKMEYWNICDGENCDSDSLSGVDEIKEEGSEMRSRTQSSNIVNDKLRECDSELYEDSQDLILYRYEGWKSHFSLEDNKLGKIVILCHNSRYSGMESCLAFYYITLEPITDVVVPYRTLELKAGVLGLRISSDQRYLVYNRRLLIEAQPEFFGGRYDTNIQTVVYDIYTEEHLPTLYTGSTAGSTERLSYIFPDMNQYYLANGGESHFAYVWDRHYGALLSTVVHDTGNEPTHTGVNAVAFHPHDQEILVSVADDFNIKIWMSKNRKNSLPCIEEKMHEEEYEVSRHSPRDKCDIDSDHSPQDHHSCCFCTRSNKSR